MHHCRRAPPTPTTPGGGPAGPAGEGPVRPFAGGAPTRESFREAKYRVQNRLINELDPKMDLTNQVEVKRQIEDLFGKIADEEGLALTRAERVRMLEQITDEILGLGPLEPLLRDATVTEVMVNGPQQVYIEREGKLELTGVTFQNDEHVMKIIQRIIAPIGRRIDESSPMVDARLVDGSRVNAIIPPLSLVGPVVTIRKFAASPFTVEDLIRFGTSTAEMFEFLEACVKARLNVFVSGGTGSGKTTTLNVLSSFIPDDERIVTIEDAAELQLRQEHVVTLEARPSNIEGKGAVPIRELVRNALRMRPDRIVVGEVRSGEALDMLQAMNTGHDGSMSTGHANSPRDMLARLETMVLMAGMDLPLRAIREQTASAVDLIVHQNRLKDGTRKIVSITEVQGMEGDVIVMQDVFTFEQTGVARGTDRGPAEADRHSSQVRREVRGGRHPPAPQHLRFAVLSRLGRQRRHEPHADPHRGAGRGRHPGGQRRHRDEWQRQRRDRPPGAVRLVPRRPLGGQRGCREGIAGPRRHREGHRATGSDHPAEHRPGPGRPQAQAGRVRPHLDCDPIRCSCSARLPSGSCSRRSRARWRWSCCSPSGCGCRGSTSGGASVVGSRRSTPSSPTRSPSSPTPSEPDPRSSRAWSW